MKPPRLRRRRQVRRYLQRHHEDPLVHVRVLEPERWSPGLKRVGIVCLVAYVGSIFAANWAIVRFGPVPVGFGLMAPAGVYFAGLAFTLRDVVQDALGRVAVVGAILTGGVASAVVSPRFAFASATAFLLSEFADFVVYTPIRDRAWLTAVVASNVVGFVFDSVLFLWLAFHSLHFLPGQIVGKAWSTAIPVALLWAGRRRYRRAVAA